MSSTLERCTEQHRKDAVAELVAELAEFSYDGLVELQRDLERGEVRPFYKSERLPDLKLSPVPQLALADLRRYSSMAVQFSRGCPFTCEFCDIIEIYGRRTRR